MWATWNKKRAHGFKVACGLASWTSLCVVQSSVSCLGNLSSRDQSNCWSSLASASSPTDQQAGDCQFLGSFFCCCMLRQDSGWDEGRGNFAMLCSYVKGLVDRQLFEWNSLRFVSSQVGTQCSRWLWRGWLLCLSVFVQSLVTGSMTFDHLFQASLVNLVYLSLSPLWHDWQELIPKLNGIGA